MEIKGRDLIGGIPKTIKITSVEVREALQEPIGAIVDGPEAVAGEDAARAGERHRRPRHRHDRRRRAVARDGPPARGNDPPTDSRGGRVAHGGRARRGQDPRRSSPVRKGPHAELVGRSMPSRGSPRSTRKRLVLWITCAGLSGSDACHTASVPRLDLKRFGVEPLPPGARRSRLGGAESARQRPESEAAAGT